MSDCIFCKIINGEIPSEKHFEDNEVIVIEDIHPQAPIHLLVIPKIHIRDIMHADDEIIVKVFTVAKKMIKKKQIKAHRLVANGKGAQVIEHLHIHVMGGVQKERKL